MTLADTCIMRHHFLRQTHHEDPCEAKVGNFADVVLADQNVPGCQVSVNVVLQLQESHARGNLGRHLNLLGDTQRDALILCNRAERHIISHSPTMFKLS